MNNLDIMTIIVNSYQKANLTNIKLPRARLQNKKRSHCFQSILTDRLVKYFTNEKDIMVFSTTKKNKVFRRNEYLYDLHVCKISYFTSNVHNEKVPYIVKSVIQIESEFEPSTFDSSIDFSKLVCGKADLKAMILPLSNNTNNYTKPLGKIAENIDEPLFMVFLPHPKEWDEKVLNKYKVFEYVKNEWVKIEIKQ